MSSAWERLFKTEEASIKKRKKKTKNKNKKTCIADVQVTFQYACSEISTDPKISHDSRLVLFYPQSELFRLVGIQS